MKSDSDAVYQTACDRHSPWNEAEESTKEGYFCKCFKLEISWSSEFQ